MMIAPTLSEANVRTEVPIVLAEKRERGGTAARVADATPADAFRRAAAGGSPGDRHRSNAEWRQPGRVRAFHSAGIGPKTPW